jgi:hypothetical protein
MPNDWGTAMTVPAAFWTNTVGGTNVTCPAGVETTVMQVTVAADSNGTYMPLFLPALWIACGTTAPSNITIAQRVLSGSDFATQSPPAGVLTANNTFSCPNFPTGPISDLLWRPPGTTLQFTLNPTGQQVTCLGNSYMLVILFRVHD